MRIREFTGKSFSEVFRKVKSEIGEDAVILETKEEGGIVKVVVAMEEEVIDTPIYDEKPVAKNNVSERAYEELFRSILLLRNQLKKTIEEKIKILPPMPKSIKKRICIIGDESCGKTTVATNLSLYFRGYHRKNHLISLDYYKPWAEEEMSYVRRSFSISAFTGFDKTGWSKVEKSIEEGDIIVIDTPPYRRWENSEYMRNMLNSINNLSFYWCVDLRLPASYIIKRLKEVSYLNIEGIILTFADRIGSVEGPLSLLSDGVPPVAFINNGIMGRGVKSPSGETVSSLIVKEGVIYGTEAGVEW